MLTLQELSDRLLELIQADPANRLAPVTFGGQDEPVAGGIIGVRKNDPTKRVLNLAPVKLDQVGGF